MAEAGSSSRPAWDRFWFGEGSLVRLAVFRMAMMLAAFYALWHFRVGVFQHATGADAKAFLGRSWTPIYAFEVLGLGPPGATAAHVAFWGLVVAIGCATVGLFTRTACAVVALLSFYWIGAHYSHGKPHHDCVVLMFGLLALPFAPVGARLSIDSLLRRLRQARSGGDPLAVPERAPWAKLPLLVTQITAALGYFFSGASKLVIGGWDWANGYTLQGIMLEYPSPWTEAMVGNVFLCRLMSFGLVFVQASFPLVFLPITWRGTKRALRWFYLPMAVLFHLLAMQTMATGPFITLWFTLVAFVELEKVPAFLRRNLLGGPLPLRIVWTLAVLGASVGTALLYTRFMPRWFLLVLLPVAATAVSAWLRRDRLAVRFDPGDARARVRVAWLSAFDWAGRLRFEPKGGTPAGLEVRGGGGPLVGHGGLAAARSELPLVRLVLPWAGRRRT